MASVKFFGDTFALNESVSEIALMEFAEASADGLDADMMQGLAAMMRLVKECIAPVDLKRFLVVARKNHAKSTDLIAVLEATFKQVTDRPTGLPADSSDGQQAIEPKSVSSSVDKDWGPLNGRPDLQLAVTRQRSA